MPMGRFVHGLGRAATEALWPTCCLGCDVPGSLLCPACIAALPVIDQAYACPRCGAPFGSLVCTECTGCLEEGPGGLEALDGVGCYGVYGWPLDRVLRGYKDCGERRAAVLLAEMLAQAAGARGTGFWDCVTFVPCTRGAFARRGHDHMEAVAQGVGHILGLPVLDALARREVQDQRGLTRLQRAANVRNSLVAVRPLEGRVCLLVDDVLTTGATLVSAAHALRQGGAGGVFGACVARAW